MINVVVGQDVFAIEVGRPAQSSQGQARWTRKVASSATLDRVVTGNVVEPVEYLKTMSLFILFLACTL